MQVFYIQHFSSLFCYSVFYMRKFWLLPFLRVLGCSVFAEVCNEIRNHQKIYLNSIFKNKITLG